MKIVFLTDTFSRRTGSIQRLLSKYFARRGAEAHVITMDLSPYYQEGDFRGFVEPLAGGESERIDGFQLHVVRHQMVLGYPRMVGLSRILASIRPDIVQCQQAIGWIPLDAARYRLRFKYKLFSGNHNAYSTAGTTLDGDLTTRLTRLAKRFIPGRLTSYATERCYAPTADCAEIAWRYYGVQRGKVEVMHLGVDTDYFHPVHSAEGKRERDQTRASFGAGAGEIVCTYSGKMSKEKNALILAKAVGRLRGMGKPYSALFIGNGEQRCDIEGMPYCHVLDFMEYWQLGSYFRASDVGVWTGNESSSQLDCAACGIPIIISDKVFYRDHVTGNGLVFRAGDVDDLVSKLLELESAEARACLGTEGAEKMASNFSWDSVARRRMAHYQKALDRSGFLSNRPITSPDEFKGEA